MEWKGEEKRRATARRQGCDTGRLSVSNGSSVSIGLHGDDNNRQERHRQAGSRQSVHQRACKTHPRRTTSHLRKRIPGTAPSPVREYAAVHVLDEPAHGVLPVQPVAHALPGPVHVGRGLSHGKTPTHHHSPSHNHVHGSDAFYNSSSWLLSPYLHGFAPKQLPVRCCCCTAPAACLLCQQSQHVLVLSHGRGHIAQLGEGQAHVVARLQLHRQRGHNGSTGGPAWSAP